MQFTTLVFTVLATLPSIVFGTENHVTGTVCDTITSSIDYKTAFASCLVPACVEIKPVSLQCGCTTIPTVTASQTICPTKCAATSYVTAIVDCFPTSHPPSSSSSGHSSSSSPTSSSTTPVSTTNPHTSATPTPTPSSSSGSSSTSTTISTSKTPSSPPSTTPILSTTPYTNSTKTKTETHIVTLTTCPASVTCTGQTVTFTSTEICPTSTCTCVLPSVTVVTTLLPGDSTAITITTSPRGSNTPPSPATTSLPPTFSQAVAAGRAEVGMGALGAFALAMLGMI